MAETKTARIAQLYGYGNSVTTSGAKEEVPVFPRTASSGVIHKNADGSQTDVQTALNGKANASHTHAIADVSGLQTALNGKAGTANASQSSAGLMSASDKQKLDGIADGANKTSIPDSLPANGGTADKAKFVVDSNDSNNINITYSKAGQASTDLLASWNGYEIGAISPANVTAGRATADGDGNNIVDTYALKSALAGLGSDIEKSSFGTSSGYVKWKNGLLFNWQTVTCNKQGSKAIDSESDYYWWYGSSNWMVAFSGKPLMVTGGTANNTSASASTQWLEENRNANRNAQYLVAAWGY